MASAPIPTTVQQAREMVATSDYYAMCHLMLASYAYAGANTAANAVASIVETFGANALNESTNAVPTNPNLPNCAWQIQWGPFAWADNSNLMYAAHLMDLDSQQPIMATIAIRGTDIDTDLCPGVLQQIVQDMDVGFQSAWTYPMPKSYSGVELAAGSMSGFQNKILKLSQNNDGKNNIADWAAQYALKNPGVPLVVTGHSLGGCQATVLAAYLCSSDAGLPAGVTICPNPFAGPTAGNQAFAAMYDDLFGTNARRWVNTLDVAPMAFDSDDLNDLSNFWHAGEWACPQNFKMSPLLDPLYGTVKLAAKGKGYTQPAQTPAAMTGACTYPASPSFLKQTTNPTGFGDMLTMQHFPPAYQYLMGVYMTSIGYAPLIWPAPQTAA
jgi:hypothetical protein